MQTFDSQAGKTNVIPYTEMSNKSDYVIPCCTYEHCFALFIQTASVSRTLMSNGICFNFHMLETVWHSLPGPLFCYLFMSLHLGHSNKNCSPLSVLFLGHNCKQKAKKNPLKLPTSIIPANGWNFHTPIRKSHGPFFCSPLSSRELELFKLAFKPQFMMLKVFRIINCIRETNTSWCTYLGKAGTLP